MLSRQIISGRLPVLRGTYGHNSSSKFTVSVPKRALSEIQAKETLAIQQDPFALFVGADYSALRTDAPSRIVGVQVTAILGKADLDKAICVRNLLTGP